MSDMLVTPKTRKEVMDELGSREGVYTRSLIGRAFDLGRASGTVEGYREGFKDANAYGCKVMIACSCKALHVAFGFGESRMQRFAQVFRDVLLNTIDAQEAIQEMQDKYHIEFEDEIFEEG